MNDNDASEAIAWSTVGTSTCMAICLESEVLSLIPRSPIPDRHRPSMKDKESSQNIADAYFGVESCAASQVQAVDPHQRAPGRGGRLRDRLELPRLQDWGRK